MFKKALVYFAILAASTSGLAYATPAAKNPDGIYVGAGIISDTSRIKGVAGTSTEVGMNGVAGELLLGYSGFWDNFFWTAAEVFGQLSSNKGKYLGFNQKQESNFGIRVMPGFQIANGTVLFGNVGFIRSRFVSDGPRGIAGVSDRNGLQLGVGMETMLNCNLGLRGGWNWNRFVPPFYDGRLYNNQFYLDAIYHFVV